MGGIGQLESWNVEIKLRVVNRESNPRIGMNKAMEIISKAREYLLDDRQIGIPAIVRKIDMTKIEPVPYPLDKKKTLYGATGTFNVLTFLRL